VNERLRCIIAEAWLFRTRVEREAAHRFGRLADAIDAFDPASPVPALLRRAAGDEVRHAGFCAELSAAYGNPAPESGGASPDIAPGGLAPREAVLYEMVAACCITETESVATLTTLMAEDAESRVREILHEIARDEVVHSRMGWAHLAREAERIDVSFLSSWIPPMLSGTVSGELFTPGDEEMESAELLRHGVLPRARKREIFVGALEEIVLPGLERFGVDSAPARAWLAARLHSRGPDLS
jgi:hypothetical protein